MPLKWESLPAAPATGSVSVVSMVVRSSLHDLVVNPLQISLRLGDFSYVCMYITSPQLSITVCGHNGALSQIFHIYGVPSSQWAKGNLENHPAHLSHHREPDTFIEPFIFSCYNLLDRCGLNTPAQLEPDWLLTLARVSFAARLSGRDDLSRRETLELLRPPFL